MCSDQRGADFMLVAIRSLFSSHKNEALELHILTDGFTKRTIRELNDLESTWGKSISIHKIDASGFARFPEINNASGRITRGMYYRFMLPDILKEKERVIYIDTDVIVVDILRPIWETPMDSDDWLAASAGSLSTQRDAANRLSTSFDDLYINSGVLLMNLDAFRREEISRRCVDWLTANLQRASLADQDALNCVCRGRIMRLHPRYNLGSTITPELYPERFREEFTEAVETPAIIHFAGPKPWVKQYGWQQVEGHGWKQWEEYRTMQPAIKVWKRRKLKKEVEQYLKYGFLTAPLYRVWANLHRKKTLNLHIQ